MHQKNVSTSQSHLCPSPLSTPSIAAERLPSTRHLPPDNHPPRPFPPYTTSRATMADHDDLHAEPTEGFRVGEKKTIDEYQQLGTCAAFASLPVLYSSSQL